MPLRGIHYIILAVVVGLVAAFSIHRVLIAKSGAAKPEPMAKVVVSEADISSGSEINAKMVKVAIWPQHLVHPKAARTLDEVIGRVVNIPITAGEPVLLSKLAAPGTAGGLGGLLSPNMLAFTVKVDDVSGVGGFLNPGDHVDILTVLPKAGGEQLSKIILQDVKLLTTGQIWEQSSNNQPKTVNTVTLEVTPEQSEILNLASNQGKIRLTLRSRANKMVRHTAGVSTSQLTTEGKTVAPPPAAENHKKTVEVIKGIDRKEAEM